MLSDVTMNSSCVLLHISVHSSVNNPNLSVCPVMLNLLDRTNYPNSELCRYNTRKLPIINFFTTQRRYVNVPVPRLQNKTAEKSQI